MPKRKTEQDENEIAFGGLQELLRRDAERDKKSVKPPVSPAKKKAKTENRNSKTGVTSKPC